MIVSLLVIGAIAWVLTGAVEDTIRSARGDTPAGPRKGFRGYLDDRWAALADRHHRNSEEGLLSSGDKWAHKRHLARKKALAFAGFKTDEDIARAAYHHRRRLRLINQGIEPDTVPPPPGSPLPKRRKAMPDRDAHSKFKPPTEEEKKEEEPPQTEPTQDLDTTDVPGLTDLNTETEQGTEETPKPETQPWTPFNEPEKENSMTTGEINSPADVKAFADATKKSLDATVSTVDTLNSIAAGLADRITDHTANALAAEHAAAGMDRLDMADAAAAARAMIEQQQQIQAAMQAVVEAIATSAAAIADQVEAARPNVAAIDRAYAAQLAVADARSGAGRGNLARDTYLDGDV